jgi:hypothetical protein
MTAERIEFRIEPEDRRKLAEMAEEEHSTLSEVMRDMIRKTYEERMRKKRIEAAEALVAMELDDVPDPDELSRQLAAKYDFERLS